MANVMKTPPIRETDLFGYVRQMGGKPINAKHPFNTVDAVVLCRISYFPLESFIENSFSRQMTVHEMGIRMLNITKTQELGTYEKKDMDLLKLMINSIRYKNMKVCGFHSHFSVKKSEQFAACTILLNKKVGFVSFRGTDATFNGWREDFDLGILGSIPSHSDALSYVKSSMNHFKGKSFMFAGHSKGGNLAAYVAMNLPNTLRKNRFLKAYVIDGPGFRKDVLLSGKYQDIQDKVVSLAPVQSIVGMILYSPFEVHPIASKGMFILQHDVYLWKIQKDWFVEAGFEPISYVTKRWTITLFEHMSIDQIKMTLDALFGLLMKMYGDTVSEIFAHPWRSLLQFSSGLRTIEPQARETLKKSIRIFIDYYKSINQNIAKQRKVAKTLSITQAK